MRTPRKPPPPKSELERLYLIERKSTSNIGSIYGCSGDLILKWLRIYEIPIRPSTGISRKPPKSKLEQLYLIERKSASEISIGYRCSYVTVLKWLRSDGITVRTSNALPIPPREDLIRLYNDDGMTFAEIGEIYGCSHNTVWKWLKQYEIPRHNRHRTKGCISPRPPPPPSPIEKRPAKAVYKNTCGILKDHAQDLKDDPERLSTEFLQKMIGVKCD